ncbi:RHS repeat-associated core domain-containing protein [Pyxidicoccus sp. 3LG]
MDGIRSECQGGTRPGDIEEVFDGLDNDCNGAVDDGFSPGPLDGGTNPVGGGGGPRPDKDLCRSELLIGDPFDVSGGNSYLRLRDVQLPDPELDLSVYRTFNSDERAWLHDFSAKGMVKPFGPSPTNPDSLLWWHNYYSFVSMAASVWTVRDLDGSIIRFTPCGGAACVASPDSGNSASRARLTRTTTGFVLHEGSGRELVYGNPIARFSGKPHHYFLTEIRYKGKSVATLEYIRNFTISNGCNGLLPPDVVGAPYLTRVRTRSGAGVQFGYKKTIAPDSQEHCVLASLSLLNRSQASEYWVRVIDYAYVLDGTVERPGRIAKATAALTGDEETYSYSSGEFTRRLEGTVLMRHVYGSTGLVGSSLAPGEDLSVTWNGTSTCDPSSTCCVGPLRSQLVLAAHSGKGDGTEGTSSLTQRYDLIESYGTSLTPRIYRLTESCGGSPACSEGTTRSEWTCPGSGGLVAHEFARKNKRDFWEVYAHQAPPAGKPAQALERTSVKKGALDSSGTGALEETVFTYTYGPGDEQLVSTESQVSVMDSAQLAGTRWVYAPGTQRVVAQIRSGWTQVYEPSTGAWTEQERFLGTFYLTSRTCSGETQADPLDRVVEVHGPCWVDSANAVDCPAGADAPVTQYHYWGGGEPDNNRNQLWKVSQYTSGGTSGCASRTPLVTTFDEYTSYAMPSLVTDPNGVTTQIWYTGDRVRLKQQGSSPQVQYYYFAGKLEAAKHPAGNWDVFCYRTGTPDSSCTGGVLSDKLQWRATATGSGGHSWSEKVVYAYWPDGTLKSETYLTCPSAGPCNTNMPGEVRRVRQFAADAHQRPTWERTGTGAGAFTRTRLFDGADNGVGIGHAYNNPPSWCGGASAVGQPLSTLCNSLFYDRADRLAGVDEFISAGSASRTCISHDVQGNISEVRTGCPANATPGDCSACAQPAATYRHDDFGNIVAVSLPTAQGPTRMAYDASGILIVKQTPQQFASSSWVGYTYDTQGRMKDAVASSPAGSETLFRMGYDSDGTLDASCPQPVFTQGRLRWREDSFGKTWYAYTEAGWVSKEIRLRTGATACTANLSDNANPVTEYTHTLNGRVASIKYPHGRTVKYIYGSQATADRIWSVQVPLYNGTAWQTISSVNQVIENIKWEPFGGLRSYEINSPSKNTDLLVEYLQGDDGTVPPMAGSECAATRPVSPGDSTGRMRGLWVSSSITVPAGDIYKRTYTWAADQVARVDTCLLGATVPRTEAYAYDGMLRLTSASRPSGNFAASGGAFSSQNYQYDGRGNRTGLTNGSCQNASAQVMSLQYGATPRVDQLVSVASSCDSESETGYAFDADGRVSQMAESGGRLGGRTLDFSYGASGGTGGAVGSSASDTVFKSVLVNGVAYNYFFDAFNRRRLKVYPTGASDEYFHDVSNQLLSDRGNESLFGGSGHVEDDYVWLDGRPVVLVRGRFDAAWARQSDASTNCGRNGESAACGLYFVVTDHIGKPVLMLNGAYQVTGAADYEPFGHVNRVALSAGTANPYGNGLNATLADFTQPVGGTANPGTALRVRVLLGAVDTESNAGTPLDFVKLKDGSSGVELSSAIGGHLAGQMWTPWVQPSAGRVQVAFSSNSSNCCPDGQGGLDCGSGCGAYPNYQYTGVAVTAYEYQRYQAGAQPFWTPLRFPGQYYDAETDLFENWNRYYDPGVGRYLQPEPMAAHGAQFSMSQVYGYAKGNPLFYSDANGLLIRSSGGRVGDLYDAQHSSCPIPTGIYARTCITQYDVSEPTACRETCDSAGKKVWGFDVDLKFSVLVNFRSNSVVHKDVKDVSTGQQRSVRDHEADHVADMAAYFEQPELNKLYMTEGFSSKEMCENKRKAIALLLRARRAAAENNTKLRDHEVP